MNKKSVMKYLGIPALATGMLLSGTLPALTITSLVIHAAQEITTPGGIVDLKKGGAAITIEAMKDNRSSVRDSGCISCSL